MAKVITTELQHSGASGANITLGSSKDVTFHGTVSGDNKPFRNLIINGAMQVNQRGTVANAGNEYAGPDRYLFKKNDGAMTISQDANSPEGFGSSWKCDVTSVSGTAGANYVYLQQRIEAQNLQHIKKGTSNAQQLTLSFWIKSTKTGTYIAEIWDNGNSRGCSKSYTVNTTNTWEKKTITFPADTTGTIANDNSIGLMVNLWIFAGSSYTSGTLQSGWQTTTANRAVGQVNGGDNTSNDILFTGIQLETGETATDFEHRSYGDELARCQRYYYRVKGLSNGDDFGTGFNTTTTQCRPTIVFPVTMRTAVSALEQSGDATDYMVAHTNTETTCSAVPTFSGGSEYNARVILTVSSGLTAGQGSAGRAVNSDGYLGFSAEL